MTHGNCNTCISEERLTALYCVKSVRILRISRIQFKYGTEQNNSEYGHFTFYAALMKKAFTEELEKQQQSFWKFISDNFEIMMKEIKNTISEVNELKKIIKFSE